MKIHDPDNEIARVQLRVGDKVAAIFEIGPEADQYQFANTAFRCCSLAANHMVQMPAFDAVAIRVRVVRKDGRWWDAQTWHPAELV